MSWLKYWLFIIFFFLTFDLFLRLALGKDYDIFGSALNNIMIIVIVISEVSPLNLGHFRRKTVKVVRPKLANYVIFISFIGLFIILNRSFIINILQDIGLTFYFLRSRFTW